jgi:hypothetical protein
MSQSPAAEPEIRMDGGQVGHESQYLRLNHSAS